jgi:mRNA deadenylase 3'-5' endonuclease subunit Ccr4
MSFSVASYNVLAEAYIRPDWYPNTPAAVLAPSHRHPTLLHPR